MRPILTLLFCFIIMQMQAQPGAFGGYDMSFKLMDAKTKAFITNYNRHYKIYPTYYLEDKHVVVEAFKFNPETKAFSYKMHATPVGPAIPDQFTINIVSGKDTMKVYFAERLKGDTLLFKKGEFVATNQFYYSKSIKTYNSSRLLNNIIYDYATSKLEELPFYLVAEQIELKVDGTTYSCSLLKELPDKDFVAYGVTNFRVDQPDPPIKDLKNNDGIVEIPGCKPSTIKIDYNFEILDSLLSSVSKDFSLKDAGFKEIFPSGLNFQETNGITFAIVTNLKVMDDQTWYITLNQNKDIKQIYLSQEQGKNWKRVFSIRSESLLNLQIENNKELYAFTKSDIYYSGNSGKTWSENILRDNTQRIYDLVLANDTTGFILVEAKAGAELLKFNPVSGKTTKLLGDLGCCFIDRKLNQKAANLFYYQNKVVLNFGDAFIISKDLGSTWQVLKNDCTMLLKKDTLYSWYKGKAVTEKQEMNYGHYFPKYSTCGIRYHFKSVLINRDKRLYILGYYNKDGVGSPHFIGDVNFVGL